MLTVEFEYIQTTWKRSTTSINVPCYICDEPTQSVSVQNNSSLETLIIPVLECIWGISGTDRDTSKTRSGLRHLDQTEWHDQISQISLSLCSPIETDRLADGVRQGEPQAWWKRGDNVFSIRSPAKEALHQGDLIRPFPNNPIDQSHYFTQIYVNQQEAITLCQHNTSKRTQHSIISHF